MPHLSSTSDSSRLLLPLSVLAFLTPLLLCERLIVPRHSGRAAQVAIAEADYAARAGKQRLLLGDSTGARLRSFPGSGSWINLSLGGSTVSEWRLLLERALREQEGRIREVVVMATAGSYQVSGSMAAGPYLPYLARSSDLLRWYREAEMPPRELLATAFQRLFLTSPSRSELVYSAFSVSPALQPWANALLFRSGTAAVETGTAREGEHWRHRAFGDLARLARAHGAKLHLVISPVAAAERAGPAHQEKKKSILQLCSTLNLHCISLDNGLPDSRFDPDDPVHPKDEHIAELHRVLESSLR